MDKRIKKNLVRHMDKIEEFLVWVIMIILSILVIISGQNGCGLLALSFALLWVWTGFHFAWRYWQKDTNFFWIPYLVIILLIIGSAFYCFYCFCMPSDLWHKSVWDNFSLYNRVLMCMDEKFGTDFLEVNS